MKMLKLFSCNARMYKGMRKFRVPSLPRKHRPHPIQIRQKLAAGRNNSTCTFFFTYNDNGIIISALNT